MATAKSQTKWRRKNYLVKSQLNVVARKHIHEDLERFAESFQLRGKGEAVTFAAFVTRALIQRADYDTDAARMLDDLIAAAEKADRPVVMACLERAGFNVIEFEPLFYNRGILIGSKLRFHKPI